MSGRNDCEEHGHSGSEACSDCEWEELRSERDALRARCKKALEMLEPAAWDIPGPMALRIARAARAALSEEGGSV